MLSVMAGAYVTVYLSPSGVDLYRTGLVASILFMLPRLIYDYSAKCSMA